MSSQQRSSGVRWGWIIAGFVVAVAIGALVLQDRDASIQYYMTVSEYHENAAAYQGKRIKLAGRVKTKSLVKENNHYRFSVEDLGKEIHATYAGLAPDTFKEGVEVVVEGIAGDPQKVFVADHLMAKCASKYQEGGLPPIEQMRSQSRR
jgi:cytochrome c-type biogenesis protein CcmE